MRGKKRRRAKIQGNNKHTKSHTHNYYANAPKLNWTAATMSPQCVMGFPSTNQHKLSTPIFSQCNFPFLFCFVLQSKHVHPFILLILFLTFFSITHQWQQQQLQQRHHQQLHQQWQQQQQWLQQYSRQSHGRRWPVLPSAAASAAARSGARPAVHGGAHDHPLLAAAADRHTGKCW